MYIVPSVSNHLLFLHSFTNTRIKKADKKNDGYILLYNENQINESVVENILPN